MKKVTVLAEKKAQKTDSAPAKKKEKLAPYKLTEHVRRLWIRIRNLWGFSNEAFYNALTDLKDEDANLLYDLVKLALFRNSWAQIVQENPALHTLIGSEEDYFCMIDTYQKLSWKLNRREEYPKDKKLAVGMKGRIGRLMPDFSL